MAYKRNIDRLPIPPKDAKVQNVTCPFCIVGCGYKAISWPVDKQGGPRATDNFFGNDLTHQQEAETADWFSPAMYNIVKQNGREVHLVIKPDKNCEVNSGLGSIRGARKAELSFSTITGTQGQRLSEPLVWRYGRMTADLLGRRDRSGGRGDAARGRRPGRGRPDRVRLRSWRRRRRLREHLGDRQALFREHEDQEHPDPQSPGVQQRSPRHARHGRRRAEQLLRRRRTRRYHLSASVTNALRDQTDYFLNHWVTNLGRPAPTKRASSFRTSRTKHARGRHRPEAHGHRPCLRSRGRHGERPASGDRVPGPISIALQRADHRDRGQGLGRPRFYREVDDRLRNGRAPTKKVRGIRRGRWSSPASNPMISVKR